jgi:hypothetical protein
MTWVLSENSSVWLYPSPVISYRDRFFPPRLCRRLAYRLGNWFTTIIFNRKALLEIGGFHEELQGLTDLFAALVLASRYGAAFSPVPLRVWRIHDNSVLSRTLSDTMTATTVVKRFEQLGIELAPELFTPDMLARTELRLHFASLRASKGRTLAAVGHRIGLVRLALLGCLARVTARAIRIISVGLMFSLMRPFDVLPLIRYRLIRSSIVRVRELLMAHWGKQATAVQS